MIQPDEKFQRTSFRFFFCDNDYASDYVFLFECCSPYWKKRKVSASSLFWAQLHVH